MPGKMVSSGQLRSLTARFSRSSSFTLRVCKRCSENGLVRSSPSVRGRLMRKLLGTNTFSDYTREERALLAVSRWQTTCRDDLQRTVAILSTRGRAIADYLSSGHAHCRRRCCGRGRRGEFWGESFRDTRLGWLCALAPSAIPATFV